MEMNKVNVLNKVFSKKTLHDILGMETSNSYAGAIKKHIEFPSEMSNAELMVALYEKIKQNYRNEYFYKNTLLNKLLIGVHKMSDQTTVLTELPVANSKADFVLLNGKAIVYEIKTELDNFDRLESQIHDYYKVFDHVAVVIGDSEASLAAANRILDKLEYPVGIHVLKKNDKLSTIKKAMAFSEALCFESMFKLLRKSEHETLILKFYDGLPQTTQFKYYDACKKMLKAVDMTLFYEAYLQILKKRIVVKKDLFANIPYELKFLTYFMNMNEQDYRKLEKFLIKPYGGVV